MRIPERLTNQSSNEAINISGHDHNYVNTHAHFPVSKMGLN